MIDVAVVGLGRIGVGFQKDPLRKGVPTHAEAWKRHPETRLVAGVDPDPVRRREFEELTGTVSYADWRTMWAVHQPQIVSICTPPDAHEEAVYQALASGAARVICEKPCTGSLHDARRLRERLGSRAGAVGVNYQRRFDALNRWLTGLSASSEIIGGCGTYSAGLLNTGSHWIDGLLSAGCEIESVLALDCVDGDDPTPTLQLRTRGGHYITLLSVPVSIYTLFETDLLLRDGRVRLFDGGAKGEWLVAASSRRYTGYAELRGTGGPVTGGLADALLCMAAETVRSLSEDRPMCCTLDDAIRVHEVIEAAKKSLATNAWVRIE